MTDGPGPTPTSWPLTLGAGLLGGAMIAHAVYRVLRSILAEPEYDTVGYDHDTNQSVDRRSRP